MVHDKQWVVHDPVPMAEDGDASNAVPSILHLLIAPTTSSLTKAYSAMTIPSRGSTPNIDGKVNKLNKMMSVSYCNFIYLLRLLPYAQSQREGCKGSGIIYVLLFTYITSSAR